jgi:threonine dehydratase
MITKKDIEAARDRIARYIHRTPLIYSRSFSEMSGAEVHVKAENLQKTGSFK